jgi:hypothetical protein
MAKPEYLLAMKVEALSRAAERDIADVISLSNHLGISNTDEVLAVRERYFTDKPSMEVLRVLNSITEFAGHEMDETDAPVKPK